MPATTLVYAEIAWQSATLPALSRTRGLPPIGDWEAASSRSREESLALVGVASRIFPTSLLRRNSLQSSEPSTRARTAGHLNPTRRRVRQPDDAHGGLIRQAVLLDRF